MRSAPLTRAKTLAQNWVYRHIPNAPTEKERAEREDQVRNWIFNSSNDFSPESRSAGWHTTPSSVPSPARMEGNMNNTGIDQYKKQHDDGTAL